MLNLVTNTNVKFIADDRELKRRGPSYTIDTLRELQEETKAQKVLVLILGIDAFLSFCQWHRYDEILSFCHIMLLQRSGYTLLKQGCERELYDVHVTDDIMNIYETLNGHIFLSDEKIIEISSTAIRQCISEGEQPRYLLPGNVWNYIRRNNLYQ